MSGMGTTVVQAVVRGGVAHFAHMGDSRAYLFHHDQLQQITRDHSYVQEMVDSGKLSAEEAERHPKKNLITRALGVSANIVPEYNRCEIEVGDILLLCSDGLSNVVTDQEILYEVIHGGEDEACCQRLLNVALHRGAPDNVTVVLMRC